MTQWQLRQQAHFSLPKVTHIDDFSHAFQALEILEQRHRERTGDQLPKDMRFAILLSTCPTDLEMELTAQQHCVPRQCTDEGTYCHSDQQPDPWFRSNDDGKFERRGQQSRCW